MIVRMARVEVVGPRPRLLEVLTALCELESVQIDGEGTAAECTEVRLRHLLPDADLLARRLRLESLRDQLAELRRLLPPLPVQPATLDPETVIGSLERLVAHHLADCRVRCVTQEGLRREAHAQERQALQLAAMDRLAAGMEREDPLLELVGVSLHDVAMAEDLRREVERQTSGRVALVTEPADDGTLVGVLAAEPAQLEVIRLALDRERVPELVVPAALQGVPLVEQSARLRQGAGALLERAAGLDVAAGRFARRWLPIYLRTATWIDAQLLVLKAAAEVAESEFCFYFSGWMPTAGIERARAFLEERFHGEVVLTEQESRADDLARAPVALSNPPYLRPFELFLRLMPLPLYTSYDPTPFLGLFFPLFFGMMLGDIGYGAILLAVAVGVRLHWRTPGLPRDISGILLPCALSTIAFGSLFGELFGTAGAAQLGLHPLLCPRDQELGTIFWFALGVGTAHILLGLVLGVSAALRVGARHEARQRGLQLLLILTLAAAVVAVLFPVAWRPAPLLFAAGGVLLLVMLLSGGLLAPLEALKTIGNIISYVRLMAIGLTSVLLAQIANTLGGKAGNIIIGMFVAGVLHLINLVLGVFAPTVHALRLHYVEFFSKFFTPGGRGYRPLEKPKQT